jgi:hypothetical protein
LIRRSIARRSTAPTSSKDRKHKTHRRHRHTHHAPDEPRTRTKYHARHHGGGKEEMKVLKPGRRKRPIYGEQPVPAKPGDPLQMFDSSPVTVIATTQSLTPGPLDARVERVGVSEDSGSYDYSD